MKNLLTILLIVLASCANVEKQENEEVLECKESQDEDVEVEEDVNEEKGEYDGCDIVTYHPIEYSTEGTYVAEDGVPYFVSIHYENRDDANQEYTAKDLGRFAHAVYTAWKEQGMPEPEKVRKHLQNFHIINLHTDELRDDDFARHKKPKLYQEDKKAALDKVEHVNAFVFSAGNPCYADIPEDANFFIVLRHYELSHGYIGTLIHELLHPACRSGLGDAQGDHSDPKVWPSFDDPHNIHKEAVNIVKEDEEYALDWKEVEEPVEQKQEVTKEFAQDFVEYILSGLN